MTFDVTALPCNEYPSRSVGNRPLPPCRQQADRADTENFRCRRNSAIHGISVTRERPKIEHSDLVQADSLRYELSVPPKT